MMTALIVFTLIISILVLYINYTYRKQYYTFNTLYKLRAIRHKAILDYIDNREDEADKRYFIDYTNAIINNFTPIVEKQFMTLRGMFDFVVKIIDSINIDEASKPEHSENMKNYYQTTNLTLLNAFKAVPFGKFRLLLLLCKKILHLLMRIGIKKAGNILIVFKRAEGSFYHIKNHNSDYNSNHHQFC